MHRFLQSKSFAVQPPPSVGPSSQCRPAEQELQLAGLLHRKSIARPCRKSDLRCDHFKIAISAKSFRVKCSHTWHDFSVGEMSCEKIVIGSDIFVAYSMLLLLKLYDPVYEKKRKPASKRYRFQYKSLNFLKSSEANYTDLCGRICCICSMSFTAASE